jgi:glycosyltransferase involved in cell wall biosynthesis
MSKSAISEEEMKISFYSNYLNHHQIPFCNEMYKLLGDDFKFIATEPMEEERVKLGWGLSENYPYELRPYENADAYNYSLSLGLKSDVVIIGSAPDVFIRERLKRNKLTFRYWERPFKRGAWRLLNPRLLGSMLKNHTRYRNKNLYLLCASAYTAWDVSLIGAYPNKTYKWGYFPEVKKYNVKDLFENKNQDPINLLWCGRFIDCKHPEKAVWVMKRLNENGFNCTLDFIGDGPIYKETRNMVTRLELDDRINFFGSMSPNEVREYMETANIYLFTSDRQEGWGAVLNESMNSGCAVVASDAIGSVPFLIKPGENGFIYRDHDINDLYNKVEILVKDAELRKKLGANAVRTMEDLWSPKVAAQRLVEFSDGLLVNKIIKFEDGPCSKAEIYK